MAENSNEKEFPLEDSELPESPQVALEVPAPGLSPTQVVEVLNHEVPGLGMTGRKLRKLIRKGSIEATKEGGRWRLSPETTQELIELATAQMAARNATQAEV